MVVQSPISRFQDRAKSPGSLTASRFPGHFIGFRAVSNHLVLLLSWLRLPAYVLFQSRVESPGSSTDRKHARETIGFRVVPNHLVLLLAAYLVAKALGFTAVLNHLVLLPRPPSQTASPCFRAMLNHLELLPLTLRAISPIASEPCQITWFSYRMRAPALRRNNFRAVSDHLVLLPVR